MAQHGEDQSFWSRRLLYISGGSERVGAIRRIDLPKIPRGKFDRGICSDFQLSATSLIFSSIKKDANACLASLSRYIEMKCQHM